MVCGAVFICIKQLHYYEIWYFNVFILLMMFTKYRHRLWKWVDLPWYFCDNSKTSTQIGLWWSNNYSKKVNTSSIVEQSWCYWSSWNSMLQKVFVFWKFLLKFCIFHVQSEPPLVRKFCYKGFQNNNEINKKPYLISVTYILNL